MLLLIPQYLATSIMPAVLKRELRSLHAADHPSLHHGMQYLL